MSEKPGNKEKDENNNYISLSTINTTLYDLFNNKNYLINNFLLKNENLNSDYIIDIKEINIFNLFLIYTVKTTKFKDIFKYIKLNTIFYKKNKDHIQLNQKTIELSPKIKLSLPKFLNICIFNSNKLCKLLNMTNKQLTIKLFELIQIFFLNNIIDKENLVNILRLKLISCLYKENDNEYNEEFLEIKNKTILNIFSLEVIIKFLLSFNNVEMDKKKEVDFINIINDIMRIIDNLFLSNYNNKLLLSNSLLFYRLIELSQISLDCITNIIPILLKVYKYSFNIDYCLNDLSEQFLFKKNENINKKNNNIIAKNQFLYELFNLQNLKKQSQQYSLIPNGFVFNDVIKNGVILFNNNSFYFPNESFSLVISFNLRKEQKTKIDEININNNKKYTLFSFVNIKEIIDFNLFIENNILKITLFGKIYDLFPEIEFNKIYVLWHFVTGNNKKSTSIFYLNDKKLIKNNLFYPKGFYDINLGFNNNENPNNFIGILGTFILFNKCFIKDENSKNTTFYEENLLGLKCNYEDISYINYKTDFSSLNSDTKKILNKLSSYDNISRFIDIIISSKSVMSNDFCCCSNKNRKIYKANYFIDKIESQSMISFNAENIDINLNNYNFNCQNCLITYPIHFNVAFDDFINNNGIKFLELELYYFMGIMDTFSECNANNNNLDKGKNTNMKGDELDIGIMKLREEKDLFYFKLQYIFNLFLYCLKGINKTQEKKIKNDINNFFYTLNNLISLSSKNGFKIDLMFLTSITSNINFLIEKNKFFDNFGFIFEYDSYNPNNDKVFEFLFQNILIYLDDYSSNFLSPNIFANLLNFDKIYLSPNIKDAKKIYSQLIRKCLSLSLSNNNEECFKLYMRKIKNLRGVQIQCIPFVRSLYSHITEEEISEEAETHYINAAKKHQKNLSDLSLDKKVKITPEEREKEQKKMNEQLILMYKALRNLYLSLDKKNKSYRIFINYCEENDEEIVDFFNNEFNYLEQKYKIKKINYESNSIDNSFSDSNNASDHISDSEDTDENLNININEIMNKEEEINIEKNKKYIKYSELIKALCIRFIDEITYEENIKNLRNLLTKEEKSSKQNINLNIGSVGTGGIFKSISTYNLIAQRKNSSNSLDNFYLNTSQNSSTRLLDINPLESILIKKFDFFYEFTLSPYTFNSFFLLIFRNLSTSTKLKYIKNQSNIIDKLLLSKKNYSEISYFIPIVLQLINRIGEEDFDTIFMNKIELLELAYDKFNILLFDMLDYFKEKKEEVKHIIKSLFCKKDFGTTFYLNTLDCLKRQKDMTGMIYVFNNKYISNDKIDKNNSNIIDTFFAKIKNNIHEIIDRTIFELTDPFYFKLLFEIYIKDYRDDKNCDFVLNTIQYIIDKFNKMENENSSFDKNYIKEKIELCHKNILLLIYKITFFIYKRKYLIENNIFIKQIVLYLSIFCNRENLLYLKVLFPIEEKTESNKLYNKKLIIEMLFEIFIDLYLEFKKNSNEQESCMFEALINDLLFNKATEFSNSKSSSDNISDDSGSIKDEEDKKKKITKSNVYTTCYKIDELSIKQNNQKLKTFTTNILKKYLKETLDIENHFSVTILFLIKISIYIKKLEEVDKNSTLLDLLINISERLCKDAQRLQQKYTTYTPLASRSPNTTSLYDEFQNYILKDYIINKSYNKDELLSLINKNYKIARKYACVAYTREGKARLFSIKSHIQLISSDKKKSMYSQNSTNVGEGVSNYRGSMKDENLPIRLADTIKSSLGKKKRNSNSSLELNSLGKDKQRINSELFSTKKEKNKFFEYKVIPKFLKFFVRNHFSLYFLKLLTYDEDFIKVKKIYDYIYHDEIYDINAFNLNYPSKLKNRLGNNYVKHFLKKDFNFATSEYFKYSHKCIYKRHFIPKTKNLFPSKKILEVYDYAHKDFIINKSDKKLLTRNCELITYAGAVFGDIYIFQNCVLFKSDLKNDKRKIKDSIDCACCCMDFDFLEENLTKIMEFSEIREVLPRKFVYAWMALEVFMKNGKSYLFNFFNEETNNYVLDLFKNNNVHVIKNAKEYFDKKEYTKKWKDGRKSTYDHLLILNKFSSRSYNDANQYPLMPWIFMSDNRIRNFDIPMSVQSENGRKTFLQIPYDAQSKENRWHSNHYSTSAYICYYLMRINPFTESMIKFQSNNFDVPDRQFFDIGQTLILCEKNNNNREPIPELYTIPEIYLNLNNNDFGKQALNNQGRIHNVECYPYADNAYEFVYKFKFMLNNNEEINTKINLWFDFIFGVNQYNRDNLTGDGLRNFNKYSYAQNINIKKIIADLKKRQKSESYIYNEIKSILGMIISFGQCPFKLLTSEHPKRIYSKGVHKTLLTNADKTKLNKDEQELFNDTFENISNDKDNINEEKMLQKTYDNHSKKFSIIYFRKSLSKNNLYCILNSKEIEVYQKDTRYKEYKYKKKINVSKNYLLFKKTAYGYPILKPKYLFCELKEEHFIFCRYLDNSIKLVTPRIETQILLNSFITSVIRINEKEFITGDNKGKLCHWKINLDNILNIKLKLIKQINSNNNSITSILYNERLNIIISADNKTVIIRSFYDFEFLTYFNVFENENNNGEIIVDIKVSNYDFVYILINQGNNNYKLKGYSLNGICFGEYEGKITNFELTKEGRVLVGLANMGIVNVLDPINFNVLYSRFIISNDDENECLFYHFYFEKPNIIFFGFKDQEGSKIRLITLDKSEIKFFI